MRTSDEQLRQYLQSIGSRTGGIEAMAARASELKKGAQLESVAPDPGQSGQKVKPTLELTAAAQEAVERLDRGLTDLTPFQRSALEAIIIPDKRPAFDIVDDDFVADHDLWTDLSSNPAIHGRLKSAIPSVGRVELPGQQRIPYGGTGFVVGADLLMTNRHVAEIFASGIGDRTIVFRSGWRAGVDFKKERDSHEATVLEVRKVRMIHPWWDMALLEVPAVGLRHPPLRLSVNDARDLQGRRIALIGYPAYDPLRNDPNVQNELFHKVYRIKRLLPGEIAPARRTESFGKLVDAAAHDASSLGGASGSAMVDLDTGEVLGLHFGGRYLDTNFAVPTAELSRDPRVVDAGVSFPSHRPALPPAPWLKVWDRLEAVRGDDMKSPHSSSVGHTAAAADKAAASITTSTEGGHIVLEIPIRITIELGRPDAQLPTPAARSETTDAERMVEPQHDPDYRSRQGYSKSFLEDRTVPMPKPVNKSQLAHLKAGGTRLDYQNFSILMHKVRRIALITASNVSRDTELRKPEPGQDYTRKGLGAMGVNDVERWFEDPRMDSRFQLPDAFFTNDRGSFDKGHIVRREDVAWGTTLDDVVRGNGDTFHVTNCSPQVSQFNQSARGQDNWGDLENAVFAGAAQERLCVFAGPVLAPDDQTFVGVGIGGQPLRVRIPSRYWKVIVAATEKGIAAHGFILEQDVSNVDLEFTVPENFRRLQVPLAVIEVASGVDFGAEIRDSDAWGSQEAIDLAARTDLLRVTELSSDELVSPNSSDDEYAAQELGIDREALSDLEGIAQWRVARSLVALRRQVDAFAPGRSIASDGTIGDAAHASRASDHNPWVRDGSMGIVTAMDITHDPAHGCDSARIAQAIVASRDPRVKYVIWNRQIANASAIGAVGPWTWRAYGGSNPHNKHVHVSVNSEQDAYDNEGDWQV